MKKVLLLIGLIIFGSASIQAQLLQMTFEVDSTATISGPAPIGISASAGTLSPGSSGKGLAAQRNNSVPKRDIDLTFANTAGYWDVASIDLTIDYQREESDAWFFLRTSNNLRFGTQGGRLQVRYAVDNGSGGQTTINSGNVYNVPNDDVFRTYRFNYDNVTGIGGVYVNGTQIWTNDGPDNRDLYWSGAGNFVIGSSLDASGRSEAVIDGITVSTYSEFVLPVELVEFNAHRMDMNTVQLFWATASEINNDFFEIQRSEDGEFWTALSQVPGAGKSNRRIEYIENDYAALPGESFYRLRQVDYDGTEDYSNTVYVPALPEGDDKTEVIFQTFPNPIERGNRLNLVLENLDGKDLLLVLRDVNGRELYVKTTYIREDKQYEVIELSETIPAGQYIITATSDNAVYNSKLMVR